MTIDFNLTSPQDSTVVTFSLTCNSTGGPVSSVIWTRDGLLLDNTSPLVLTDVSTASYTNVLQVNGRTPGTYTCQIRGADNQVLSSADFTVHGSNFDEVVEFGNLLSTFLHTQLLLLPSMFKPLSPVPLPQWRSAGVLHLVELLTSLATGSSMGMERMCPCQQKLLTLV